jgi:hypothetical protein
MIALPLLLVALALPPQSGPVAAPLRVLATSPALNALNVPRATNVSLTFNRVMDPALFGPRDFQVIGRWSGPSQGTLFPSAGGMVLTFVPQQPFSAGELVTVLLARSVKSPSGSQLERGYCFTFWVDSRASSVTFTKSQTLVAGITPYGAWGGDMDHDGDLDLCVPNEDSFDVSVFLNGGTGTYGRHVRYGVGDRTSPNEGADFDFDGHVDLALGNIDDDDVSVLFGNGDGTFQPQVRIPVGIEPRGLALLDVDSDGDFDILTANRANSGQPGSLSLILNRADGTFAPAVPIEAGVSRETSVFTCDMNNDGLHDAVVAGYSSNNVAVLLGDGRGGLKLHSTRAIGNTPWMLVCADLNGDGFNDVGAALSGASSAAIALNDGLGGLGAPMTYPTLSFPIAIDFGDLNGDGHLDLATSTYIGAQFRFYLNNGSGVFAAPFNLAALQSASCTVLHDVDNDGDVDITGIDETADRVFIFKQDG